MRTVIIGFLAATLAGCQTTQVEVRNPCGIIRDDLRTVQGKTQQDQTRISAHYVRGKAGGCW